MKKNLKKIVLFLSVFTLIAFTIGAANVNITWNWEPTIDNVNWFRYQLDKEEIDGWIFVDKSVTTCTIKNLDDSVPHILYLQQSVDKKVWSDSAINRVEVADMKAAREEKFKASQAEMKKKAEEKAKKEEEVKKEPTPVKEEKKESTFVEKNENASVKKEEPKKAEKKPETKAAKTKSGVVVSPYNKYNTMISFGGGCFVASFKDKIDIPKKLKDNTAYGFRDVAKYTPYLNLDFTFNNIASWGKYSGFGLKAGASYQFMIKYPNKWKDEYNAHGIKFWEYNAYQVLDSYFAMAYNLSFGKVVKLDFFIGGFADFSWKNRSDAVKLPGNVSMSFGAIAGLSNKYQIGDVFVLGLTPMYRYEWGNDDGHQVLAEVSMGFKF